MNMKLATKPDFEQCAARVQAWYDNEIIDRPPIRFHRHNAEYEVLRSSTHSTLAQRWEDAEYQAKSYLKSIENHRFLGETFPVYMPNLGPNVYAAFFGAELDYSETTSWCEPIIHTWDDLEKIKFNPDNKYYRKIHELTAAALEICDDRFLVGYTDLHPGMDCVAAWRGSEQLCFDMIMEPERVHQMMKLATEPFVEVYNDFDRILKAHGQPSTTWMNMPFEGRFHIPSNDFSFMISDEHFEEFAMPAIREEIATMSHNIFHVDGLGVVRHTDLILSMGIHVIQFAQGMGDDYPIMQHIEYIKYLQSRGCSVIVDLDKADLDAFMDAVPARGIFLWIATENEHQELEIIKRISKWAQRSLRK